MSEGKGSVGQSRKRRGVDRSEFGLYQTRVRTSTSSTSLDKSHFMIAPRNERWGQSVRL
jgi:hypothetical protein